MKTTIVRLREPRALAIPGWRGGPAVYASQILSLIYVGRHARSAIAADNDNSGVAA